ncbi:MAG: hypothetical protein ACPG21_00825 [Crocinitomicaceae bacterium]
MSRGFYIVSIAFLLSGCKPGNLTHERFVFNNSGEDTVMVYNPDFEELDTLYPGDTTLVYRFEMSNSDTELAPCAWGGDTLIIYNQDNQGVLISVNKEDYWISTIQGDKEKRQRCYFVLTAEDFPE